MKISGMLEDFREFGVEKAGTTKAEVRVGLVEEVEECEGQECWDGEGWGRGVKWRGGVW